MFFIEIKNLTTNKKQNVLFELEGSLSLKNIFQEKIGLIEHIDQGTLKWYFSENEPTLIGRKIKLNKPFAVFLSGEKQKANFIEIITEKYVFSDENNKLL